MRPSGRDVATILAVLLLMAAPIAVVAFAGDAGWNQRLGFVLQVLAVYGVGIGFVQKSEALKNFPGIDDMTSPHPLRFLRGNALFLGMMYSMLAVALGPRASERPAALGVFGQAIVLGAYPLVFLYTAVHILLIMPFAYLGYLFTSALVESIAGSSADEQWTGAVDGEVNAHFSVRSVIAENRSAMKSFLIGVPATLLGLVLKGVEFFA